ncbi:MAG: Icc-related predicted phosphoesterase [Pirellulaceae bacterium]|jgi:Icc-related predicted phosphoesterase
MSGSERQIAVFGDTHGHIRLLLLLCRLLQQNSGVHLDGVLQCGDIGFFPDPDRVDRATKKFAKRDPEELGFWQFFSKPKPQAIDLRSQEILCGDAQDLGTLRCPIFLCHGNHEDFELLESVISDDDVSTIDYFDRLQYVRSGKVVEVGGLRVAVIGGSPENENERDMPPVGPRVSAAAVKELAKQEFDVLITHGGPQGIGGETELWGSQLLRKLIESTQPKYHFFAHHGKPLARSTIGKTNSVWHNDTSFERSSSGEPFGCVHPGAMSVLRWKSDDDHELVTISDPWFRSVTGLSWEYL